MRYADLLRIGAVMKKARPFVALPDWSPGGLTDSDIAGAICRCASAIVAFLMYRVHLPGRSTNAAWRDAARRLASHRILAEKVEWTRELAGTGLFRFRSATGK